MSGVSTDLAVASWALSTQYLHTVLCLHTIYTISTHYLHNIYSLSTQVGGPGDPEVPGEELRHDHEEDRAAHRYGADPGPPTRGRQGAGARGGGGG